ncbi:hypothetical protein CN636_17175 [Bacillus toyonensis]|nr:hypothetical protein CN636_17175 [Bacillus toyonensis]
MSLEAKEFIKVLKNNEQIWNDSELVGSKIKSYWGNEDEKEVFIAKFAPDTFVPLHDHPGREFTYVLKGEMRVNNKVFNTGDFLTAGSGDFHEILFVKETVCLIITEKNIQFIN